jgi:crossover junction endodeoxyribonuclease RuvC
MSVVVGIDLSLTSTGWAMINPDEVTFGTVKSKGYKDEPLKGRWLRQTIILDELISCVGAERPRLVVIEGPAYAAREGSAHDRSGLWWALVALTLEQGIPVAEVPPTVRAKYATGKGNAPKSLVFAETVRRFPDLPISNDNEADALVVAAMGARHLGEPIDSMPKSHLAAMDAVHWPEVD